MSKRSTAVRQPPPTKFTTPGMVLHAMKRGKSLHHEHLNCGQSRWSLSCGAPVPGRVAAEVIADSRVVDCGGALFTGVPGQVFRFIGDDQ